MHDDIVSNVRENLHYLDVSIFNHILSGRWDKYLLIVPGTTGSTMVKSMYLKGAID